MPKFSNIGWFIYLKYFNFDAGSGFSLDTGTKSLIWTEFKDVRSSDSSLSEKIFG